MRYGSSLEVFLVTLVHDVATSFLSVILPDSILPELILTDIDTLFVLSIGEEVELLSISGGSEYHAVRRLEREDLLSNLVVLGDLVCHDVLFIRINYYYFINLSF